MSRSRLLKLPGAAITAAALLAACRYQPTPVLLQGTPADIAALAGKWEGEYTSRQSGRTGSIVFTVQAGLDTAYGDVLMIPAESGGQPVTAADAGTRHAMHARLPELLRVTFIRVGGGLVQGELEPYIAPDCQCIVTTFFRGTVEGNAIKGEYVTRGEAGLRQTGQWSVTRTVRQ